MSDDASQSRFAHTRGTPEYERRQVATLYHLTENSPLTHEVVLAYVFIQRLWTQSLG